MSEKAGAKRIEAAARELYAWWCEDGGAERAFHPDWEAWSVGGSLNGNGLTADSFREDASAILGVDEKEAGHILCFRSSGCASRECPTYEDCTVDDYFVDGARRALAASRQ